jgi:tryptophan synthase alpha chain
VSRIEKRFDALKREGRAGLVTFITAGDPDAATSDKILAGLAGAGADIIELGMPFSDPMADGPAIQASSLRALKAGANMKKTLAQVRAFRKTDSDTPIVLMGYYNPIYIYGREAFAKDAADAGVDGLIVVDLPPEEGELQAPAKAAGLDFIYLATPTSDAKRLPIIVKDARGFIYYVSVTGITGTRSAEAGSVADAVMRLRGVTKLPIAVGFGIKTPTDAATIAKSADAVVVGSAIVEKVRESGDPAQVLAFVRALSEGVRAARR